jgi:putative cell wall-binding protein
MVMVPKRREVEKMRRCLMVVVAVALAALVFAPAAFAQDDNPSGDDLRGDDRGGERDFDDNPSGDDLREDDRGGVRGFDDNPTGDDVVASPTATATPTASATPTATVSATDDSGTDTTALPTTGGAPILSLLSAVAGVLLIGSGTAAAMLLRRRTS